MPPIGCRCFEMARFSRCDGPFYEAKRTFAKKRWRSGAGRLTTSGSYPLTACTKTDAQGATTTVSFAVLRSQIARHCFGKEQSAHLSLASDNFRLISAIQPWRFERQL